MKSLVRVVVLLAGAAAVNAMVTACGGGESRASADTAKTATCTNADLNHFVRVDLQGFSASEIVRGIAYSSINEAHDAPGASYVQTPIAAGDGFAYVQCYNTPGTVTVVLP